MAGGIRSKAVGALDSQEEGIEGRPDFTILITPGWWGDWAVDAAAG